MCVTTPRTLYNSSFIHILSRLNQGFDSPTGYQIPENAQSVGILTSGWVFSCLFSVDQVARFGENRWV